jgi:hypothetical protein
MNDSSERIIIALANLRKVRVFHLRFPPPRQKLLPLPTFRYFGDCLTTVASQAQYPGNRANNSTASVTANQRCPHQPKRRSIKLKIAASMLYGPAPDKMTTINMTAYKVSGR